MNEVEVCGDLPLAHQLAALANRRQNQYRFTLTRDHQELVLHVTAEPYHGLYRVFDEQNVIISTWQSDGLCRYSGISVPDFLTLCALLGLAQARAVQLNPSMRVEDFLHPNGDDCLFVTLPLKQQFAEILERPRICGGCIEFYRCLQLEPEMDGLARFLRGLQEPGHVQGFM